MTVSSVSSYEKGIFYSHPHKVLAYRRLSDFAVGYLPWHKAPWGDCQCDLALNLN